MTIVLVLISLALTTVARFVTDGKDCPRSRPSRAASIGLLAATLLIMVLALKFGQDNYRLSLATGLGLGAVAVFAAEILGGLAAPIGVAVAVSSLLHFLPGKSVPEGQFALLAGLSIGAICLPGRGAFTTAIVATACVAGDFLGAGHKNVPGSILMGSELGVAALLAVVGLALMPKKLDSFRPIGIAVVIAAAAFIVSRRIIEPHLAIVVGIAAASGLAVHFLVPDGERDIMRIIIGGIIAVSVASIAYSFYRNAGIAAALATMLAVLIGSGNRTGMLAISLVFGLVLMRLLQKADTGYNQSLDIGQHLILVGFFVGALVPLLPVERVVQSNWREGVGVVIWTILLLASTTFVEVMMGHRGINGFVAGLGMSGIISALRPQESLQPLAIAPGLVGVSVFCLDQFDNWTDLSKDHKVKFFIIAGVIALAMAGGIVALARQPKTEVAA